MGDPQVWARLMRRVWLADEPALTVPATRDAFLHRLRRYRRMHAARLVASPPWLREFESADEGGVQRQELEWLGRVEESHGNTVGLACMLGTDLPDLRWPTTDGSYELLYFEMKVLDAGLRGYLSIGFCREDYRTLHKQPGWMAHSYGYHGDDGCAFSGCGFGRRFAATYGAGQVVGCGLVLPADGTDGRIFFTLDGQLVGTPFTAVERPDLLRPSVGLHSPNERLQLCFGGSAHQLLHATPCGPPAPFAFDVSQASTWSLAGFPRTGYDDRMRAPLRRGPSTASHNLAALLPWLPWALHEVASLAAREDGGDDDVPGPYHQQTAAGGDARSELLRYARHKTGPGGGVHASWGAQTIYALPPHDLRRLCIALLQRDAARAAAAQQQAEHGH